MQYILNADLILAASFGPICENHVLKNVYLGCVSTTAPNESAVTDSAPPGP